MYICMDVGNTNIVIGIFKEKELIHKFRFCTNEAMTSDDYGIKLIQLLDFNNIKKEEIDGFIISSVVPKIDYTLSLMVNKYLNLNPLFVGPGLKSGIKIKLDNPKQLGADLLVGAVAAVEKYGSNILVIDIGTAMTFVYINGEKEFLGGAILPGIKTAFSSLTKMTSKLEEVGLEDVKEILGRDTKGCIQSGMIFGWSSLIEGMIKKYQEKFGDFKIVMTGGETRFVINHIEPKLNIVHDEDLLLYGLSILYEKNRK